MSGPGPVASVSFDPRPLTEPVDRNSVVAFARRLRQNGQVPSPFNTIAVIVTVAVICVFVFVFGTTFVSIIVSVVAASAGSGGGGFGLLFFLLPVLVMVGVAVAIVVSVARALTGGRERWYRLDRFARANGMTYVPQLAAPALPGMIFGVGDSRHSTDLVRGDRPRFVEFGNYSYTTGSGKDRTTHQWGYVAVRLDVPLPNIVLDATSNNSLFGSNLPASFGKDQRLRLEGDFDQHFALYAPVGYERDALYLFTPDIMARFIDNSAALDVEIVDDWLFLYGQRAFSTLDPATWAWLFSVVGALLDKFAQWSRWRDERLAADAAATPSVPAGASAASAAVPFAAPPELLRPPPGVAPPGRRLTRRFGWVGFVVIGVFMLIWLFQVFAGGMFALFS
ncbi:hypothetical protein [Microbacterium pumilum]|uniref:DUF3137 domain-containing protein n=1 Tax=Microbacterium pumilum TaxID=344165 RepID=A0ABN2RYB7_9MICO